MSVKAFRFVMSEKKDNIPYLIIQSIFYIIFTWKVYWLGSLIRAKT